MSSSASLEEGMAKTNFDNKDVIESKATPKNDVAVSIQEGDTNAITIDAAVQRSIVRKLDTRLLPILSCMYLFNAIDRSNLGNARTDTLLEDLHMTGAQYSLTLVLFYVTFCGFDVPANMLLKRSTGKIMLPSMMLAWGSVTLLQCAAYNWAGLLACRLFMGLFEAGFMAGVVYYLTTFYRRNELALRISLFYGAATIAGAFSGLIAYGVFQIHHSTIPGWKFLMVVEGGLTVLLASFAYWYLPSDVKKCDWFTEVERVVAEDRMLRDSSTVVNEDFSFKKSLGQLLHWTTLCNALIGLSYGSAAATVGNWIPVLVRSLGFSTVKTNLYTVAPYCVGTVVLLVLSTSSDHFRERSFHLATAMTITLLGFIILAAVDVTQHQAVGYFACFLLTAGAFVPSCIFHAWHNNNHVSENGRAAVTGFMVGAANSGGIVSSLSFKADTAPRYLPALISGAALQTFGIVLVLGLGTWYRWDNGRRDKLVGRKIRPQEVDTATLTGEYDDAGWRWTA